MPPHLQIVIRTDPGRVRALNEDRLAADPELGLAILADGMGGQAAGSHAAELAVATVQAEVTRALSNLRAAPTPNENYALALAIREGANQANRAIRNKARSEQRYRDIGTTLIVAVFHGDHVTVAYAGDSRLYRLREDRIELLTRDHSILQDQLEAAAITPEAARLSHNRHIVSRALGMEEDINLDFKTGKTEPGDLYLVCSDGLNDMVEDEDIELVLSSLKCNLDLAADQLVMIARDMGGHDNISVILAHVEPAPEGWFARVARSLR